MLLCLCCSSIMETWLTGGMPTTTDCTQDRSERRRSWGQQQKCGVKNKEHAGGKGYQQGVHRPAKEQEEDSDGKTNRHRVGPPTCCWTLLWDTGMGPGARLRKFWLGATWPGCICAPPPLNCCMEGKKSERAIRTFFSQRHHSEHHQWPR